MATRGRKSDNTVDESPESIRFTQLSIQTKFQDGRLLKDTLEDILHNPVQLIRRDIPPIEVYWSSSGYFAAATGNRRLFLFKLLCEYELIKTVPVIVTTKQKSKSKHESQEIKCVQDTILRKIVERHFASSKLPEKSAENKAESSGTPCSESKKHKNLSQKCSRKALGTLTNNPPSESSKPQMPEEKVIKLKPRAKEDGQENSTPGLRQNLRKRKSSEDSTPPAIQHQTDKKQSQRRDRAPMEMKETLRSPNKSCESEDKESPKRRRLTPSPDLSSVTVFTSATTGNSQEMEDLTFD